MGQNAGKTVATLLIGAAVGAAAGYLIATDKDKRHEQLEKVKGSINKLTSKLKKKKEDLEEEIFNS